jgi:hypothetical protein
MPITTFKSFADTLHDGQMSHAHFITNTNLEDERLWVPYANGVWFQPCWFNLTSGGFSVVLKGLPGAMVGTHYHIGTVHGYTLRGHWRWNTIGLRNLARISRNPLGRPTRSLLPRTHRSQWRPFSWSAEG